MRLEMTLQNKLHLLAFVLEFTLTPYDYKDFLTWIEVDEFGKIDESPHNTRYTLTPWCGLVIKQSGTLNRMPMELAI